MLSLQPPRASLFLTARASRAHAVGLGAALLALGMLPGGAGAQAAGTITDLGTLGGPYTEPAAMNAAGTVVGSSHDGRATRSARDRRGAAQAFLKRLDQPMVDLHDINGVDPMFVNDHEVIVGQRFGSNGQRYATYRWTSELGLQDLDPPAGIGRGVPVDLDNAGNILIDASGFSGKVSLLWRAATETYVTLPCLPEHICAAKAMNDAGTIVGVASKLGAESDARGPTQPVIWEGPELALSVLPTGTTPDVVPVDINARGTILGTTGLELDFNSTAPRRVLAWLDDQHTLRDIGDGAPFALNANDIAVGVDPVVDAEDWPQPRPRLWDLRSGAQVDLPIAPGCTNTTAIAVNDAGMILGFCNRWDDDARGYVYRGFVPTY